MRAIVLVDHGSRREEANLMVVDLAALMAEQLPADVMVTYAHMELAEPDLRTAIQACVDAEVDEVIVHPLMLTPGRHAIEDIPRMVKELSQDFPSLHFRVTPPLGAHLGVAKAVLARCEITPISND